MKNAPIPQQHIESGADYWIMWRRLAGGLNQSYQNLLFNRVRPMLLPAKGKQVTRPGANEFAEMWRAAASFERLDVKAKQAMGQALLNQLHKSPVPNYLFWCLTRLGARMMLYGPMNSIIHPEIASAWLEKLLQFTPENENELNAWAFCLSQIARMSGQRALDISDEWRQLVLQRLHSLRIPNNWARMVEQVLEMEGSEKTQLFGDSLPVGLRLAVR